MELEFEDERLEAIGKGTHSGDFPVEVVRSFQRKLRFLMDAHSEQDLRQFKSLHFEKLKGDLAGRHSIRLNDRYRLVFTLRKDSNPTVLVLHEIVDYH